MTTVCQITPVAERFVGSRKGDPVIYHRLGEELQCSFIEVAVVRGKVVVAVNSNEWGLFLAPPSCVEISQQTSRVL